MATKNIKKTNNTMTELQRMQRFKQLGYTCDFEKGIIYNTRGKECRHRNEFGYIILIFYYQKMNYRVRGHRFMFWMKWNYLPQEIDHINRIRDDNRIENLRAADNVLNNRNRTANGYYFNKVSKKWEARIRFEGKNLYLGQFFFEHEAKQAYLQAKKIYHNI